MCTPPLKGKYHVTLSAELFTEQSMPHTTAFSPTEPLLRYEFDHFDILDFMAYMRTQQPYYSCNVTICNSSASPYVDSGRAGG